MKNRFSTGDTVYIRGIVEGYGFNINGVPGFSYDIKNQFCGPIFRNVPEGIVFSDSEIRTITKNLNTEENSHHDKEIEFLDTLYKNKYICKNLKKFDAANFIEILIHKYTDIFDFSLKEISWFENKYKEE